MQIGFLVGAGASYGSGRIGPAKPPLGSELIGALRQAFPGSWGRLSPAEVKLFEPDFETGMDRLWSEQPDSLLDLLNDMGRFFIRFEPSARNNRYGQLATALRKRSLLRSTAFASLNYECILEIAFARLGIGVSFAPVPRVANGLHVLKLHGSSNFLPGSDPLGWGNTSKNAGQIWVGPVNIASIGDARQRYREPHFLPPVMSLYAPGKRTPSAQQLIADIRTEWRKWALACERIVVIGCRPNLADEHVWQPIIDSSARVLYLSGQEPDFDAFSDRLNGRLVVAGDRFDDGGLQRLLTDLDSH